VVLLPDGKTAYTANGPSNDVSVVDLATRQVSKKVPVGNRPWGVTVIAQAEVSQSGIPSPGQIDMHLGAEEHRPVVVGGRVLISVPRSFWTFRSKTVFPFATTLIGF
jgi:YVTN family beta-propeller protein